MWRFIWCCSIVTQVIYEDVRELLGIVRFRKAGTFGGNRSLGLLDFTTRLAGGSLTHHTIAIQP